MRLPPIPGRVKFRPRFGFRLHHPPVVERGAALPVRPAAEVYQSEDTERDQEPASAGQKPGDQTVPPPDGALPFAWHPGLVHRRATLLVGRRHRHHSSTVKAPSPVGSSSASP